MINKFGFCMKVSIQVVSFCPHLSFLPTSPLVTCDHHSIHTTIRPNLVIIHSIIHSTFLCSKPRFLQIFFAENDDARWLLPLPHPVAAPAGRQDHPLRNLQRRHARRWSSRRPAAAASPPPLLCSAAPVRPRPLLRSTPRPQEGGDRRDFLPELEARAERVSEWC